MGMNNLIVENKNNNRIYEVFDITYDKAGYPHFLIYRDGEWVRLSAKNFRPLELWCGANGDIIKI